MSHLNKTLKILLNKEGPESQVCPNLKRVSSQNFHKLKSKANKILI